MNLIDTAARAASTSLSIGAGVMLVVADHLGPPWSAVPGALNRVQPKPGVSGAARPEAGVFESPEAKIAKPAREETALEQRVDRYLAQSGMGTRFHCGAVVVVHAGTIALQKGYGMMASGETVSPANSLFTTVSSTNSFRTTAVDLGRFLGSLLQGKEAGPGPARAAYRRRFAQHPDVSDAVYGFYETCEARRRALFHAGASPDVHAHRTLLYLFPEEETGVVLLLSGGTASAALETGSGLAQAIIGAPGRG